VAEQKAPRVVAELGRPETPEETAARKAANSRARRSNQTLFNLLLALGASLVIVLFLILVVVRPTPAPLKPVDYRAIASQTQPTVSARLAVPKLPKGWTANSATIDPGTDGITIWSIGFLTPSGQYIGFEQGISADRTWISTELQQAQVTGSTSVAGVDWKAYNRRSADDPGNYAYSLSTVIGKNSYVLHGSATTKEFQTLAAAVTDG
jgi:hypothetical protein